MRLGIVLRQVAFDHHCLGCTLFANKQHRLQIKIRAPECFFFKEVNLNFLPIYLNLQYPDGSQQFLAFKSNEKLKEQHYLILSVVVTYRNQNIATVKPVITPFNLA